MTRDDYSFTVLGNVATQTSGAFQRTQTSLVTSEDGSSSSSTEVEGPKGGHRTESPEPVGSSPHRPAR
jgi:hypothetical protein